MGGASRFNQRPVGDQVGSSSQPSTSVSTARPRLAADPLPGYDRG